MNAEETDPLTDLTLALATAWGEKASDEAIYAIAGALMDGKEKLLDLFRHGFGEYHMYIEQGYQVGCAAAPKDLTKPIYRRQHLQMMRKRSMRRQAIDEG